MNYPLNYRFLLGLFATLSLAVPAGFAQQITPWDDTLFACLSGDAVNFTPVVSAQYRAGVPCLAADSNGNMAALYNWFPGGVPGTPDWNSIAVRISRDGGMSFSQPVAITINGLPASASPPADPSLVALPDGSWRLYFTCAPRAGQNAVTLSATSTDLLTYTLEAGRRMNLPGQNLLDPSVILFNGVWHFFAPRPGIAHGAIHATSTDGLNFTRIDDVVVAGRTDTKFWGNAMVLGGTLYFYGTIGNGIFVGSSPNAVDWTVLQEYRGPFIDPAVVQTPGGLVLALVTVLQ